MNIYEIKNNEINLDISENEFIALIGTKACGKTSLLRMLGLIEKPVSGQIVLWNICLCILCGSDNI